MQVPDTTIRRMAAAMERPVQRHASRVAVTSELNGHTFEDSTLNVSQTEDPDNAARRCVAPHFSEFSAAAGFEAVWPARHSAQGHLKCNLC